MRSQATDELQLLLRGGSHGVYSGRGTGYVYVFQDVGGRHESEGVWRPFFDDEKDAYDSVEWAAKQKWSDGKVAMQGGSYLGQNQWRAAQVGLRRRQDLRISVRSRVAATSWSTPPTSCKKSSRPPVL